MEPLDATVRVFDELAAYLFVRREAILSAWRSLAECDPTLQTIASLTRTEFNNQVPNILELLEARIRQGYEQKSDPEEERSLAAEHGLHRWQKGYKLGEVLKEWGYLQYCVLEEIDTFQNQLTTPLLREFSHIRQLAARLLNEGIAGSIARYDELKQAEAAGRVYELENALSQLNELTKQRGEVLRMASHDLRGSFGVVQGAARMLDQSSGDTERTHNTEMLQRNLSQVRQMVTQLMDLSRLEAGYEQVQMESFDVAGLLRQLSESLQPIAEERGLFWHAEGPGSLMVQGDPVKIQRIAQNLLLNALRYTQTGGVVLTWALDKRTGRWLFSVKDTGPGVSPGSVAILVKKIKAGTLSATPEEAPKPAKESDAGRTTAESLPRPPLLSSGEGVGLFIVKRLCELLNGSLDLESKPGVGSLVTITFPTRY
ncbi:hypothetical protein GCM10023189_60460 [Nibrella saemangeumensis]|uniref:histidine kinase n=1 Tax=Nibrella saemangeumensis TaxID=1084526 RepID=A0ABP8NT44_9BACT